MTREEKVKNLLTELMDMIDNGSQRDLDRADEISKSILKIIEKEPCCICIEFKRYAKEMGFEIEQEPCDDAISRQAMHIELEKWITYGEYKYSNATKYLYDRIDRLPPVTLKPKTDVLDKIIAEIEFIPTIEWKDDGTTYILASYFKKQVLEIIDKYKAESEEV